MCGVVGGWCFWIRGSTNVAVRCTEGKGAIGKEIHDIRWRGGRMQKAIRKIHNTMRQGELE